MFLFRIFRLAAVFSLLLFASPAVAETIFFSGFETGDTSEFRSANATSVSVVSNSPAIGGSGSFVAQVQGKDVYPFLETDFFGATANTTYYISFDVKAISQSPVTHEVQIRDRFESDAATETFTTQSISTSEFERLQYVYTTGASDQLRDFRLRFNSLGGPDPVPNFYLDNLRVATTPIPEPATWVLAVLLLGGLAACRR